MRFLTFVFLLFPVSAIFAQQQHITYSSGQMTPEGRSRNYFEEAYKELEAMLEGRDSLDYERAVFLTENAYWDNQIAYSDFQNLLDLHTERIRKAAGAIKEGNQHMYESLKMYEKKNFNPLASNAAIYQYLTSPRIFIRDNRVMAEALFRYSHDDPYGTEDWTNSQVLSLLNPYRREGNCYAWTALFKIFSERLKSEAHISTAPHHVYIQHKDIKGGLYNVELPSRTFPGDGTIETLTYTTREGIMSGIATRKLNLKESIGLCLIYLAKGYEYKFGESDAYFSLRCGNLALKHDSLNLNAMLLKAGVMEETLVRYMKRKRIQEPELLREIAEIKDVFIQYEQWIRRLNTLGYREIPSDVQDILLAKARGEEIATYKDRTPDAFPGLDVQDVRYITLSNGLFDEVHVKQKYMSYGRTVLDTETGRISAIVTEDSLRRYKVDPVVFALSVDPLASKYPDWSPYAAFADNPIIYIDPDGREPIPWYRRWFGEPRKAWQWYSSVGIYDSETFHSAAVYSTNNLKASAYQNIRQRNAYYRWADNQTSSSGSRWFGAAELVTRFNALGGADIGKGIVLSPDVASFLQEGNKFLFFHNMKNAKSLISNGSLSGSFTNAKGNKVSFDGLSGKALDYAMVEFEQSRVQEYIETYQKKVGSDKMASIIDGVNALFSETISTFAPSEINDVMDKHFDGGKSFNFGNYDDRVKLGQKLVDKLHE